MWKRGASGPGEAGVSVETYLAVMGSKGRGRKKTQTQGRLGGQVGQGQPSREARVWERVCPSWAGGATASLH
jgi:hypothetical protein